MNSNRQNHALTPFRSVRLSGLLAFVVFLLCVGEAWAKTAVPNRGDVKEQITVKEESFPGSFPLVREGRSVPIVVHEGDAEVVRIAASAFSADVKRVAGARPGVHASVPDGAETVLIAGSAEKSDLIRSLIEEGTLDGKHIEGKWESFVVTVVEDPVEGVDRALVVAGSDSRGTAFGLFQLSKAIGVSPWGWWADATVEEKEAIHVSGERHEFGPPSVKYRGIFLNDERWGLRPWAAKTFEPEVGNIGPKTYAKIFELLLRLKANHIWPAMHEGTLPFYEHPANQDTADAYSIVIGSSHTEVMLYNNAEEWSREEDGPWDYTTNAERMREVWRNRVTETAQSETIYQIGIRGQHDTGMEGVSGVEEGAELLNRVIEDQRDMLKTQIDKPLAEIPQVFTPYKEVLDYYDAGVDLPSDVTLMWIDDNYSNIRRYSNDEEQKRLGGGGLYYHLSYLGVPHPYLWLESTSPMKTWREVRRAYAHDMRENWIVNVGDLKRREWGMEFFLQQAWDVDRWEKETVTDYFKHVAARDISSEHAARISKMMWEYYTLAAQRKPELMGFSFHWFGRDDVGDPGFSLWNYGDEVQQRIDRYRDLRERAEQLYAELDAEAKAPFFQLVYYPIRGAASMNEKWLHAYKSREYARQGRAEANYHARLAERAFVRIMEDIRVYNEEIEDGKWQHIVQYKPGLGGGPKVHNPPTAQRMSIPDSGGIGVAIEGASQPLSERGESTSSVPQVHREQSAQNARVAGAMAHGKDSKGHYVSLAGEKVGSTSTSSGTATFEFSVEEGGRYELYATVEDHDEKPWAWESPPWTIRLDGRHEEITWNEGVGEGQMRIGAYELDAGTQTIAFRTSAEGPKLRTVELGRQRTNVLPAFSRYTQKKHFIDVYKTGQLPRSWTAEASAAWIELSTSSGTVRDDADRIWIDVDSERLPDASAPAGFVDVTSRDQSFRVYVTVSTDDVDAAEGAHVEENGVVSIRAEKYRERHSGQNADWTVFNHLGRTGAAMGLRPLTGEYVQQRDSIKHEGPALEYRVVVTEGGTGRLSVEAVPSFPIHQGKPLRTAVSINGGPPHWVSFQMGPAESRNWKYNVAQNRMTGSLEVDLEPGVHTMKVWGTDPSVNLTKLLIDFGGVRNSYLGPPETIVKETAK